MGSKDVGEGLMARHDMAQVLNLTEESTTMIMIVTRNMQELKENYKEWPVAHHRNQGLQEAEQHPRAHL